MKHSGNSTVSEYKIPGTSTMLDSETARPVGRRAAALLFVILTALSMRVLAIAVRRDTLLTEESPLLYNAATLSFNYFDFGFIRRGLGGSIVYVLGTDRLLATAAFHVLSAVCVSAAACWFVAKLRRPPLQTIALALLLVALIMRWAEDPGRTDMAVAAVIGLAAIAAVAGRPVLACLCVAVGLAMHETSFVFGIPLLAGLWLDQARRRNFSARAVLGSVAILLAGLVAYLSFERLPHADPQAMADVVRSRLPRHEYVDWAIYFAISGTRGVSTSLCQNAGDPTYLMHVVTGVLVIALFILTLRDRQGPSVQAALVVSVPPLLFLSVVANDISRWALLAAFNVWVLCAADPGERAPSRAALAWLQVCLAALIVPLIHPRTGRIADPIFAPTPVIERIAQDLGGAQTPRFAMVLTRCDPGWHSVLGD